jgi:hypothetical protein
MSDSTDPDEEELALLLADPQLREFLTHYLAIPDAEGRAHLRRVVAELAVRSRPADIERRQRLKLSSHIKRRGRQTE